jgi:hypothetical protein
MHLFIFLFIFIYLKILSFFLFFVFFNNKLYRTHEHRSRGDIDDVLGGYMLTLIDSLDSLLAFREFDLFFDALHKLKSLSFHRNIEVSVFEVNIRVLGGLLSSHQLANKLFGENSNSENHVNHNENYDEDVYTDFDENDANNENEKKREIRSENLKDKNRNTNNLQNNLLNYSKNTKIQKIQRRNYTYDGNFLLNFAEDLGNRMLPAFHTLSGIPVQRINLLNGKNNTELSYTCTAAGSTFLLEMGLLSRLSGEGLSRILHLILLIFSIKVFFVILLFSFIRCFVFSLKYLLTPS